MKQIAINLYSGLCGALHSNPGVHCPYNILLTPPKYRQTACLIINNE